MSSNTPHGYLVDEISKLRHEVNDLKAQKVIYVSVPVTAINAGASTFSVQMPNQQDGATTSVSGIASPPQFLPTVGTNVFLALSGGQPIYQPGGIAAGAVTSTEIATGAVGPTQIATGAVGSTQIATGAVGATQVQDGTLSQTKLSFDISQYAGNTVYMQNAQPSPPTGGFTIGDLWLQDLNTQDSSGAEQYNTFRWNGTAWVQVADQGIGAALAQAITAQSTANGANVTATDAQTLANAATSTANTALTVGTNFVPDPSFENSFRTPTAPWSIDSTAGVAHSGAKAAKCVVGTTTQLLMTPQPIPCLPGQIWRISAYRKTDASYNGTATNGKLRLATQTNAQATAIAWTAGTTYTQVLATYTVPSDGSVTALQLQLSNDHTAGNLWVDDVELINITDAQNALNQANAAQTTANSKITTFVQSTTPSALAAGDLWIDSGNGNILKRASAPGTGSWAPFQDAQIGTALTNAAAAQGTANARITTFFQASTSVPSALAIGDLWVVTDQGNILKRAGATGTGSWATVQDAGIGNALLAADTALTVGPNQVPDPNFEGGFRTVTAPFSIDSTAGVMHGGTKALKLTTHSGTASLTLTSQVIPVLQGHVFRMSGWWKTDSSFNGTTTNSKLKLLDQSNNVVASGNITTTTTYTQVVLSYTVPTGGTVTGLQVQISADNTAGNLWLDDVELSDITDANAALSQANTATTLANNAQTTANGKITVFYQSTAPASGMQAGDLWVDTDDNSLHRYSGSAWVSIQDAAISTALADATNAQTTANGKMTIYAQPSAPSTANPGDMWIDTDNGNAVSIWGTSTTAFRQNFAVNPSFEFDASGTRSTFTGWTNYTSGTVGTVTRSIVTGVTGVTNRAKAGKVVSSSLAATVGAAVGVQQVFGNANPGDVWRVQAVYALAVTGSNFVPYMLVEFLNSSNTVLSGSITSTGSGTVTTAQTLTATTAAAPSGTSQARVTLARRAAATTGSALVNADIITDSVLVESNRATNAGTTYFDGNSGGEAVWLGTADASTSQTYEEGTTGSSGWQPRLLRTGAFHPNSIVASDIIATGTVSAALLESLLVLTGTVIAGDQNADHAALTNDGLHLYRTVSGEGVQEIGQLAISGTGTDLQFVDANNHQVAEIDETGTATFTALNVGSDPVFQGTSLSAWLTNCTGVGNGATTGNFRGAQNYYGFVTQTGSGITSEVGLMEIGVYVDATRQYLIIPEIPVQASSTDGVCNVGVRDKGGTGNFTGLTDPLVYFRTFPIPHLRVTTVGYPALYRPTVTGNTRLLLTMAEGGTGTLSVPTNSSTGTAPVLTLIDLGPAKQITATQNNITGGGTGGSSVQPKQQYYVELSPAGTATYSGSGAHRTDTTDIVQGLDPSGFNGQGKGYWWFTLPSITGTVDRVDWYVYNNWSYFNSGGTALWNASTATGTATPSFTKIFGSDDQVAGYPKPGPVTITLPSSWYNSFKSSASPRVASITAGPDGTGNETFYCRFDGPSARLRIWFTQ